MMVEGVQTCDRLKKKKEVSHIVKLACWMVLFSLIRSFLCVQTDLAIDAFLHSEFENQHVERLIQDPHHHGLRVQRATFLKSTDHKTSVS